jgi:membrane protease YdiL (CAAX protease family)
VSGVGAGDDIPIVVLALLAAVSWASMLVGVGIAAGGFERARSAIALRFRRIDLVWVPIGVLAQLVVVPLVYIPLRAIWPSTFEPGRLEETARGLMDSAGGLRTVLLVLVVAVGAPLVEEIVYRGMLQRSAVRRFGPVAGWIMASLFFAAVHLRPIELPGLAVAGAVFGVAALRTDRLGGAVLAHAAFNATGLLALFW